MATPDNGTMVLSDGERQALNQLDKLEVLYDTEIYRKVYMTRSQKLREQLNTDAMNALVAKEMRQSVLQQLHHTYRLENIARRETTLLRLLSTRRDDENDEMDSLESPRDAISERIATIKRFVPGAVTRPAMRTLLREYQQILKDPTSATLSSSAMNLKQQKLVKPVKTPFEKFSTPYSRTLLQHYRERTKGSDRSKSFGARSQRQKTPVDFNQLERDAISNARSLVESAQPHLAQQNLVQLMQDVELHNDVFKKTGEGGTEWTLSAETYFLLAEVYWRQDSWPEALQIMDRSIHLDPFNPDSYYIRGDCYMKMEEFESAEQELTKYLKLEPRSVEVLLQLGRCKTTLNKYQEAVDAFSKAIQLKGESAEGHDPYLFFLRGEVLEHMGEHSNARLDFAAVSKIDPHFVPNYHSQAIQLQEEARKQAALEIYISLMKLDPKNPQYYQSSAELYAELADQFLSNAQTQDDDGDGEGEGGEEQRQQQSDRYQELLEASVQMFTSAMDKSPENMNELYLKRGVQFVKLGRYDRAAGDFTAVLAVLPQNVVALKQRGLCLVNMGQQREAYTDFEALAQVEPLNPAHGDVYVTLATHYAQDEPKDLVKAAHFFKTSWLVQAIDLAEEKLQINPINFIEAAQPAAPAAAAPAASVPPSKPPSRGATAMAKEPVPTISPQEIAQGLDYNPDQQKMLWMIIACLTKEFIGWHEYHAPLELQEMAKSRPASAQQTAKKGAAKPGAKDAAEVKLIPVPSLQQLVLQKLDGTNFRKREGAYLEWETEFLKIWEPWMVKHCPVPCQTGEEALQPLTGKTPRTGRAGKK